MSGELTGSQLYVLITIRDYKSGTQRPVCVGAGFLQGAIAREYHLGNDAAGERKQFAIALTQPNRTFTFRNPEAIRNVTRSYTREMVSEVRRILQSKSRAELRAEAADNQSELTRIYRQASRAGRHGFSQSDDYRDAVAHVLLEKGILVGVAHDTGSLYVDQ